MKKKNFSWLLGRVQKHTPMLLFLTLLNVLQALFGVAIALQSKRMLDLATRFEDQTNGFLVSCLVLAGIILLYVGVRFLSAHIRETLNIALDRDWKKELLGRLLSGRFSDVRAYHSGELVNRLSADVKTVNDGILNVIPGIASMVARFISATVALFLLAPLLTAVLLIVGVFVVLSTTAFRSFLKELHKKVFAANGSANSFIQEAVEKLLMIQAMDVSGEIEKRGRDIFDDRAKMQKKQRNFSLLGQTGMSLVMNILYYGALIFMAVELMNKHITIGTLTAVTQLVGQMQNPINGISSVIQAYISMLGSADRLREIFEIPAEEEAEPFSSLNTADFKDITADGLRFTYPESGRVVISDLSFRIPVPSFTAIAGESGIGKSTLLKLLLGIYEPDAGALTAGDMRISRRTRRLFSYVPQGNLLLSGTLRDNLVLTDPEASEEAIRRALYVSDLQDFIDSLPEGLDTVIGESGAGLSEGQAERLAIARAVLRDAPVILLDEATSALDPETEKRVIDRIRALPEKTVIAVTHRPYASEIADSVIVFSKPEDEY